MESIVVTLEKFEAEVLKADKPVVVILLPINYGNESDPSDDSILFFDMGLAEFKSEVQKTVGDSYIAILNHFLCTILMNFGKIKFMFLSEELKQKFDNLKRPT
jgi:hypothetical protein